MNFYAYHDQQDLLEIPVKQVFMHPGDAVTIYPQELHAFYATKPSKIIEFSTEDFMEDSIKLQLSRMIVLENLPDIK